MSIYLVWNFIWASNTHDSLPKYEFIASQYDLSRLENSRKGFFGIFQENARDKRDAAVYEMSSGEPRKVFMFSCTWMWLADRFTDHSFVNEQIQNFGKEFIQVSSGKEQIGSIHHQLFRNWHYRMVLRFLCRHYWILIPNMSSSRWQVMQIDFRIII